MYERKINTMFLHHTIEDIHHKFEDGSLDPVSLALECINKTAKFNPVFHIWASFDADSLIRRAHETKEALEQIKSFRTLEGIPVGVKDIFNTVEFPTEMGSEIWRGFKPGNDARVVYYLKNAGSLIAGKTATAEFAVHALNETLNPHNINVTPGTSSSGSAVAVALGIVPMTLGTQTGASIIRPASFCGVYGYKPSFGLLPRTGSLKTTDSLDTVGFFIANPTDLRRVFDVLRVHGPNFPISYSILKDQHRQKKPLKRPWNIAFVKTYTWTSAPAYAQMALIDFAQKLDKHNDINVSELSLPIEFDQSHDVHALIYDKSLSYYFSEESRQNDRMSLIMQKMIERGNNTSADAFKWALQSQALLIQRMDEILTEYDACICLSTSGEAPPRDVLEEPDPSLIWTLTHLPAISIPAFHSPSGLPFGLQLIARKYNDYLLLSFLETLLSKGLIPTQPYPLLQNLI
jgi:Asp-tRNA(Asn)/Glu-tRNA(Gln) amidotransferase A subunit family amidase